MPGLDFTGFTPKTLTEIVADLEAAVRSEYGDNTPLGPKTVWGWLIGVVAERYAELWEVSQGVNAATDPDNATGASLDAVCAITGTLRRSATKSVAVETFTGVPATVLATGRVVSVAGVGTRFATVAPVTLVAVGAWAPTTAYVVGDRRSNVGRVYHVTVAGTSAGAGGPTGTGTAIADGSVTWRHLGLGTAAADGGVEAEQTGPKVAASGTLTVIETPVGGWQGAVNLLDALVGSDVEQDPELRIRRSNELAGSGSGSVDAIRASVLKVDGVEACFVFENTTMVTDPDGVPAKSVEVLVKGGDDQEIREAIYGPGGVSAGIATHGSVSGTVVDSQGFTHTVKFSRPTGVNLWIDVTLDVDAAKYPPDGDDQVQAALVAHAVAIHTIGHDAWITAIQVAAFSVVGVMNVFASGLGTSGLGALQHVAITSRQIAQFDSSRTNVASTPGSP